MKDKRIMNETNRHLMIIFLILLLLGLLSIAYTGFFRNGFKELDNTGDEMIAIIVLLAFGFLALSMFIIFLVLTPDHIVISQDSLRIVYLILRKPIIIDFDGMEYVVIDIRAPKLTIITKDLIPIMISSISLKIKDHIAYYSMKNGIVVKSIDHHRGFIGRDHIEMMDHYKIILNIEDQDL